MIGRVIVLQRWGIATGEQHFPTGRNEDSKTRRLEKVQTSCHGDGLGASAHPQLARDAADLALNRIGGDNQSLSHLRVGLPGNQQTQHSLLLLREWFAERAWDGTVRWLRQHLG